MLSGDRRAVLEAIAFGSDPKLAPGDRLRALEQLREYERDDPSLAGLTAAEIEAEIDGYFSAMLGGLFTMSGPESVATGVVDPARYPKTAQALREVVGRLVERVIEERELAGHWGVPLNPLPAPEAPESEPEDADVEPTVPEPKEDAALPTGAARRELPPGIDPARGWR